MNRIVKMTGRRTFLMTMVVLIAGLNSCIPERRIAKGFLQELPQHTFILIHPDHLFLHNLSADPDDDSLALQSAEFLGRIDTDSFITEYVGALKAGLVQRGANVIDTSWPIHDSSSYVHIIDIAQLSVDEYLFNYRDEEDIDTAVYYRDFLLRGINLNTWFDISMQDGVTGGLVTLFDSYEISDDVNSLFRMNLLSGEVEYDYTLYEMRWPLVRNLPRLAAEAHAGMLFDYYMNKKIVTTLQPSPEKQMIWYTYDTSGKRLKMDFNVRKFQLLR